MSGESTSGSHPQLLVLGLDWPTLDAAVAAGLQTTVLCSRAVWRRSYREMLDGCDLVLVEDHGNLDDCLAALALVGRAPASFSGVQTTDEFAIGACDLLASLAGASRLTTAHDPSGLRDKRVQKRLVADAGLATARTVCLGDLRAVDADALDWSEPLVLKPASSAGTMHTSVVTGPQEMRDAVDVIVAAGADTADFLLESFVEGEEWIADGVVYDGEIVFWSLSDYGQPCLTSLTQGRPVTMTKIDPVLGASHYERLRPVVQRALQALGAHRGVFHLELFYTPVTGDVVFGECAMRRGGGLTFEQVLEKFGVSLVAAGIDCALGRRPRIEPRPVPGVVGLTQLQVPPGVVVRMPTAEEVRAREGVRFVRTFVGPGSLVERGPSHGTHIRTAEALVVAADDRGFRSRVAALQEWFLRESVVAPLGADAEGLRTWQRQHVPSLVSSEHTYATDRRW